METHRPMAGKVLSTATLRENAAQDRDLQMNPLNPDLRNPTGPNPLAVPPSHGTGGTGSPGAGAGVRRGGNGGSGFTYYGKGRR